MEFRPIPIAEQVADHLRQELRRRTWTGLMPGKHALAAEFGVNNKTVEVALRQLEKEGLLVPQGAGRRRLVGQVGKKSSAGTLRIGLLLHSAVDRGKGHVIDLQHRLIEGGHGVVVAPRHLVELKMEPRRVARVVGSHEVDAWIVLAGSFEVLEWFSARKPPVFALFGRRRELMIPGVGPDKPPAYEAATRKLVRLGHRRIVLLCAPDRRVPEPGASERAFLAEIAAHGIPVSRYQLPDWDGDVESLHPRLKSLFRYTPPSAMIVDGVAPFAAVMQFLCRKGLRVPEDVSVICTDHADWFDWLRPSVAHIRWDPKPVVRRIVRWADNVSGGREDIRQIETPAEFVPGGTIGPVHASAKRRR